MSQIELLVGDRRRLRGLAREPLAAVRFQRRGAAGDRRPGRLQDRQRQGRRSRAGLFHIGASVNTLLWIALALALFRLALQWPISILPAKIAADVQRRLRTRIFRAYSNASWEVQSRDREGTLQEIMTNQTSQATGGALQATSLVSTSLVFVVLMGFAIALSPTAAGVIFMLAVGLFSLMRPMRTLGAKRSRELSRAQVRYAGAIAEANRLAEESQVFGVTDAQYERMPGFVGRCRNLFFRTQVIAKAVPNIYQSLIFVLLVVGLMVLNSHRSTTREGCWRSCCCCSGRPRTASRCRAPTSLAAVDPVHRSSAAGRGPLRGQRPGAGRRPLSGDLHAGLRGGLLRL